MNVVHTITPHVPVDAEAQIAVAEAFAYHAANYDSHAYSLVEQAELVANTKNAIDEQTAIHEVVALLNDWIVALKQRTDQLDQVVKAEEYNAMDVFAKQHGYTSWKAMSDKHSPPAKSSATAPTPPSNSSSSKHPPKVYKHVLKSDAKNLTADDEPGYIRLPKEQQDSGKYRAATPIEIAKFKSDLDAWETKHGSSKKP